MITVVAVGVVTALLFAAGLAALAVYLGKRSSRGRGRTLWLCGGIAAGIVAGALLLDYTGVYYARPAAWTIVLVALATAVVALVVLVGRAAGRRARPALALAGFVVLSVVFALGLVVVNQLFQITPYPWEARARQVGEAAGFVPLLAGGRVPDRREGELVALLARPDTGLVLDYDGFSVQERRAPEVMDEAAMRRIAAVGKDPLGFGGAITPSVTYKKVRVGDTPALLVQWQPDIPGGAYMTETVSMLIFRAGDADVRVWSSQVDKPGAGGVSPDYGVDTDALIEAAETLRTLQ